MKTLLIALILAATATPAAAAEEWVHFFDHEDGGVSHFDRASYRRSGDIVRVTARWDRSKVEGAALYIGMIDDELNCAARTVQLLGYRAFNEQGEQILASTEAGEVEPIESGSVAEALFDALCTPAAQVRIN